MRALAVIAVVLFHSALGIAPGGFLGVEVFFVISGYIITRALLAEREEHGRIALGSFWLRRARRLLPAVFLLLVGVAAYSVLFAPSEVAGLRHDIVAALAYVTNWDLIVAGETYFDSWERPSLLRHLWSLAVEEQFYVVWPLVMAGGLALLGRRLTLALIVAGAVGSAILMAALYEPGSAVTRIYYGTDTRASGLLIGSALAFVWTARHSTAQAGFAGGSVGADAGGAGRARDAVDSVPCDGSGFVPGDGAGGWRLSVMVAARTNDRRSRGLARRSCVDRAYVRTASTCNGRSGCAARVDVPPDGVACCRMSGDHAVAASSTAGERPIRVGGLGRAHTTPGVRAGPLAAGRSRSGVRRGRGGRGVVFVTSRRSRGLRIRAPAGCGRTRMPRGRGHPAGTRSCPDGWFGAPACVKGAPQPEERVWRPGRHERDSRGSGHGRSNRACDRGDRQGSAGSAGAGRFRGGTDRDVRSRAGCPGESRLGGGGPRHRDRGFGDAGGRASTGRARAGYRPGRIGGAAGVAGDPLLGTAQRGGQLGDFRCC